MTMARSSFSRRGLAATVAALAVASLGKPLGTRQADAEKAVLQAIARVNNALQMGDVKAYAALVAYLNKPVRPDGKPGLRAGYRPRHPPHPRRWRQARCSRWCRGRPDRTVP